MKKTLDGGTIVLLVKMGKTEASETLQCSFTALKEKKQLKYCLNIKDDTCQYDCIIKISIIQKIQLKSRLDIGVWGLEASGFCTIFSDLALS